MYIYIYVDRDREILPTVGPRVLRWALSIPRVGVYEGPFTA